MRTDLFKRPLQSTLITDFFGGVSQAEILPPLPLLEVGGPNVTITSTEVTSPHLDDIQEKSETMEEMEVRNFDLEVEKLGSSNGRTGKAGAWTAIGILSGLVGWVTARYRKGSIGHRSH